MYVILIDKNDINKLKNEYSSFLVDSSNPYIAFKAIIGSIIIECYTSGKVVYRGENVLKLIEKIAVEYIITKEPNEKTTNFYSAIGSDEVGTGDLFGPIVICSYYVNEKDINYYLNLGIMDSKKLTDNRIIELADKLKKGKYNVILINNEKYNELSKQGYNMNEMKAIAHNKAILCTLDDIKKDVPVILDQFCEPDKYFSYLRGSKIIYEDIIFKTKAESFHVSVACASIMARYIFLKEMDILSEKIGVILLKGAGEKVDEQLKKLIDKDLTCYAKLNFKNFEKIKWELISNV